MQSGCLLTHQQRQVSSSSTVVGHAVASGTQRLHANPCWRQSPALALGISSSSLISSPSCPQRHSLSLLQFQQHRSTGCHRRGSRLVPTSTFSPFANWGFSKQTPSSNSSNKPQQPQHQHLTPQPSAQHAAAAAAQGSRQQHQVDFSAAQAAIDETGSSSDGSGFGASAKQLLQTAVHSLENFEPRDSTGSFEDEAMESFEDAGLQGSGGPLSTAHIVKANYEVLRLDETGAVRRLRIKRRDLLREHGLQPRDLRRIDPTIDFTKTSPSITIKEDVLLLNLGGIRAIVTADKALLFEPASNNTRKLLDNLVPRLQASAGQRLIARQQAAGGGSTQQGDLYRRDGSSSSTPTRQAGSRAPPFELEVLEGVLMVATGRLDAEVLSVTRRVGELLQKLPRDINPVNLEELRRIKQALVELENKADMLREMLEQIMDDEDELREINLSSRPRREERRKQRERERMERQLTRAREEMEEQARRNNMEGDERRSSSSSSTAAADGQPSSSSSGDGGGSTAVLTARGSSNGVSSRSGGGSNGSGTSSFGAWLQQQQPSILQPSPPGTPPGGRVGSGSAAGTPTPSSLGVGGGAGGRKANSSSSSSSSGGGLSSSSAAARQQRLAELYARHGLRRGPGGVLVPSPGRAADGGGKLLQQQQQQQQQQRDEWSDERSGSSGAASSSGLPRGDRDRERDRDRDRDRDREGDPEEEFQDAQDALEELAEQEEEEEELEEVEDLLEYYLQRSSATQSEAERLLEGARDLEESIGVSLSARRYEVNRLELMLSMGSFAAALGAMIAGIFGMNMKSTLEMSVFGFWGVTISIVVGCFYIFLMIMRYTQKKRIL